ncbi:hypothetical protein [Bacillus sp. AFS041924]|uniref:hypothetical protein n=1 Tax=Bacillus sp. AFS041924 TaxID=2033503 RepID=UPI000BFB9E80|nr:hypothetical protein [Bacillus sp. AFS041924]PGS48368.1 hypothetical protein COC46_18380 [Bacillus sp. AFS041924]
MKRILIVLSCLFILFGCSIKSNSEEKTSKVVGIIGVTSIDTLIYSAQKDEDLINKIEKGFNLKNVEDKQVDNSDLKLTLIDREGKIEDFEVNYKQNIYLHKGIVYKLDTKLTKLLQEQFMN